MRIFTIRDGHALTGAVIDRETIGENTIPVISVGEKGRGRKYAYIPVALKDAASETLAFADLGTTRKGGVKLIESSPGRGEEEKDYVDIKDGKATGFLPFPGQILAQGKIAQGLAGNMGSGDQLIVTMPQNTVFRVSYSGRLYGAPNAHYGVFDGTKIELFTWEQREALDRW